MIAEAEVVVAEHVLHVLQVRAAVAEAAERARRGEGPTLIEAKTYRYFGHSHSDNRSYRTREEEAAWKDRDPLEVIKGQLFDLKMATAR